MYTTWEQKYGLLEDFADMMKKGGVQKPLSGN
jgi:hypothetical protein